MMSLLSWFLWLLSVMVLVAQTAGVTHSIPVGSRAKVTQTMSPTTTKPADITTQRITPTMAPAGVNPDPPPYDGNVVIDGGSSKSIVKIYNKAGTIIFRKELAAARQNLRLNTTNREWVLLRSVVGLDNVIEVNASLGLNLNHETGGENQLFWFDAGFLRNKAYPGKVVAMIPVDSVSVSRTSRPGVKPNETPLSFGLGLVDESEGNDRLYWIYNAAKKTLESGYPANDRYFIEVRDGNYTVGHPVDVHKPSGQHREQFNMPADPDAKELEILHISFDLDRAKNNSVPISLYRMTNRNNSPLPNTIKINQEEIQTTTTIEAFYWENEYVVDMDFSLSIALPYVNNGIHFGAKSKKTVGSNSETKNSHEQKWGFDTPITAPPYSQVIFQMKVQQGQLSIPYTATMRRGNDVWEELGMYEGVNFFGLDVSIDVNDLKLRLSKNDIFRVP